MSLKNMKDFLNHLKKGERLYFKDNQTLNPMLHKIEIATKEDYSDFLYLDLTLNVFMKYNFKRKQHEKISIARVQEIILSCIKEQQEVVSFLENRQQATLE